MITLSERCEAILRRAVVDALGEEHRDVDPLLRPAQSPKFGDMQANLAMSLGKRLGENPRELAATIAERIPRGDPVESVEVAGPGFLNLRLTRAALARAAADALLDDRLGVPAAATPQTVVIDYSSPNVAKEMHVGHLRSTILGDAVARVLELQGHRVIRQNHLGDWGTQFGMLIEHLFDSGFDPGGDASPGETTEIYRAANERFRSDTGFAARARERVVALQGGDARTVATWQALVRQSERYFESIYGRLGVLLQSEDVRGESFYNDRLPGVVERLRREGHLVESDGADALFLDGFQTRGGDPLPLIVRKSDGGYPYAATDLAAAVFRVEELGADRIIYVIGLPQRQHFDMFTAALRRVGWVSDAVRFDFVGFGSVLGADKKMLRTREGGTVKLADLLDEAERRATEVVAEKSPELSETERAAIGRAIGIGALKYADLSSDRHKDYVFDWARMLSFEGNTAPYLLNAYVRIRSIFRKTGESPASVDPGALRVTEPSERALVLHLIRFPAVVAAVADALEPHQLCTYLYGLASTFHGFYESCPVAKAGVASQERASRLALCELTARTLRTGLGALGIETVERM